MTDLEAAIWPKWKCLVWKIFGRKSVAWDSSPHDHSVEITAYWFRGVMLIYDEKRVPFSKEFAGYEYKDVYIDELVNYDRP